MPEQSLPQVGDIYRHWKGGTYRVIALGYYEPKGETEPVVVYERVLDERITGNVWVRPLRGEKGWLTPVAQNVPRFVRTA